MFCMKCGAEIATDSKFCGSCGAPVTPKDTFFAESPAVNSETNAPAYEDGFAPAYDFDGMQQAQTKTKKAPNKMALIIGVAVLVLVVLVGLFACGGDDSGESPSGSGISIGSGVSIVGNWDGAKIIINDNEIDNSIAGSYSFTAKSNGTCTLYWTLLDNGSIDFSYTEDEYMTAMLRESNNDPDVIVYDLQHSSRPGVTLYYCLVNDGALALISTDDFVEGEEYEMYFLAD